MSAVEEVVGNNENPFLNWILLLIIAFLTLTQLGLPAEPLFAFLQGNAAIGGLDVTLLFIGIGLALKHLWPYVENGVTFSFFVGFILLLSLLA